MIINFSHPFDQAGAYGLVTATDTHETVRLQNLEENGTKSHREDSLELQALGGISDTALVLAGASTYDKAPRILSWDLTKRLALPLFLWLVLVAITSLC